MYSGEIARILSSSSWDDEEEVLEGVDADVLGSDAVEVLLSASSKAPGHSKAGNKFSGLMSSTGFV